VGLRYTRWKIVMKDEDAVGILVRMERDEEFAKELLRRHVQILRKVFEALGRTGEMGRVVLLLTKYFTAEELRRM